MTRRLSLLVLSFLYVVSAYTYNYLFIDGKSDYAIVVEADAAQSERTAAYEFQSYVKQISGVQLPILSQARAAGNNVYIGYNSKLKSRNISQPADEDQTYTYRTIGNDLFIYGGRQHGTMYGVFAFLERELGVRWYTPEFTKVPQTKRFMMKEWNHTESPVIKYRVDYFFQTVKDKAWTAHNLLNANNTISTSKYGQLSACWGIHTFEKLIPPADYFKTHPEYFGVYEGKRSNKTQLCLSNNAMCQELIKNLKKVINERPGFWCYDVSQNDNRFPCECPKCESLVKTYGGQSGALLWFVNKVAAEIKKTHPDIYISTLAYRYTRQAPTSTIKPANNVVIRLCDIECCMAHPLDQCPENKAFMHDLENWKRIAQNITIWDYTTGFHHYLMPFPNFDVLGRNYHFLSKSNVIGILELGSWNAQWSEWSELKQWLIAKLLWNPQQDTDSLVTSFINDYYGKAAPYVRQYYDQCQKLITPESHFTVGIEHDNKLYTNRFISDSAKLLEKALKACRDDETRRRTNRLAAQIYYLQLRRLSTRALTNSARQKLRGIVETDSTIYRERNGNINEL